MRSERDGRGREPRSHEDRGRSKSEPTIGGNTIARVESRRAGVYET